jgi:hypothetical protein
VAAEDAGVEAEDFVPIEQLQVCEQQLDWVRPLPV